VKRVQQQLQRREALLPVDDRPHLHPAGRLLDLLKDDCAEEVRVVPVERPVQEPLGYEDDVVPERLPLVLQVPDVGALEQRNDQPLGLHEDHLRRADLGFHGCLSPKVHWIRPELLSQAVKTNRISATPRVVSWAVRRWSKLASEVHHRPLSGYSSSARFTGVEPVEPCDLLSSIDPCSTRSAGPRWSSSPHGRGTPWPKSPPVGWRGSWPARVP
jgi:hypothetical protein